MRAISTAIPIDLGIVTLTDGQPVFQVTVTGKNAASTGMQFGLDYLQRVPAP